MNTKTRQCRPAVRADLAAIRAIYNYYVLSSTSTFAIIEETAAERQFWFESHEASAMPVYVIEAGGEILGFASLSEYSGRCGYRFTAEVSIYVDKDYQKQGLGRVLLDQMLACADKLGIHALLAIICSENQGSIGLFTKCGFSQVGELKEVGEKFNRFLDVSILERLSHTKKQ